MRRIMVGGLSEVGRRGDGAGEPERGGATVRQCGEAECEEAARERGSDRGTRRDDAMIADGSGAQRGRRPTRPARDNERGQTSLDGRGE
jgi:hypothetical protein